MADPSYIIQNFLKIRDMKGNLLELDEQEKPEIFERDTTDDDICWNCGWLTIVFYSEKYKGNLGECENCNHQWRLS